MSSSSEGCASSVSSQISATIPKVSSPIKRCRSPGAKQDASTDWQGDWSWLDVVSATHHRNRPVQYLPALPPAMLVLLGEAFSRCDDQQLGLRESRSFETAA
jgi:hypothetical protein